MDNRFPQAADQRPAPGVLGALEPSCRLLLQDRAALDERYLNALGGILPAGHPLREVPGTALDLLDVFLRAVLSGDPPEQVEAECEECGVRCAAVGLPDDTFPAVGRAVARAAREASGESWSSATSSGWAAVHLWVVEHLTAGASRGRMRGQAWESFPELAPGGGAPARGASPDTEWALLERAATDQGAWAASGPPGGDRVGGRAGGEPGGAQSDGRRRRRSRREFGTGQDGSEQDGWADPSAWI